MMRVLPAWRLHAFSFKLLPELHAEVIWCRRALISISASMRVYHDDNTVLWLLCAPMQMPFKVTPYRHEKCMMVHYCTNCRII